MTSTIMTLSGWAQPADALRIIAPDAQMIDYQALHHASANEEAFYEALHQASMPHQIALGWSLGGLLLMHAISRGYMAHIRHLILLAAPLQFVADATCSGAMKRDLFDQFVANVRTQPRRTAGRFAHLIAKGDTHYASLLPQLQPSESLESWQWGLDLLERSNIRSIAYDRLPPLTLIHGARDQVVPIAQSLHLYHHTRGTSLHLMPGAAHAPHLHRSGWVRSAISQAVAAL